MSQNRQWLIAAAVLLPCWFWFGGGFHSLNHDDTLAFLGTWTDERGAAGNFIRFYQVRIDMPPPAFGIEAWEGRAVFHKHLGGDPEIAAVWNYESHTPLHLNVILGKKVTFAAIKMLDHNHLLIRITDDIDTASASDVFDGPETKRLTRQPE